MTENKELAIAIKEGSYLSVDRAIELRTGPSTIEISTMQLRLPTTVPAEAQELINRKASGFMRDVMEILQDSMLR